MKALRLTKTLLYDVSIFIGHYLKFFHNVMMNSFATIYFHNYLRLDEMPCPTANATDLTLATGSVKNDAKSDHSNGSCKELLDHNGILEDNEILIKDNFDVETNQFEHKVINSIATINLDGMKLGKE